MAQLDETILYEQTGELLRYYLTWREKLLGGYIAIIAALVVAFISTPEEYKNIRPWVVAVAFFADRCVLALRAKKSGAIQPLHRSRCRS